MGSSTLAVLKYSGKYLRYQLPLFLISPVILLFTTVRPFLIRFLIDDIVGKGKFGLLGPFVLVTVTLLESVSTLFGNYAYYKAANHVVADEQISLLGKLLKVPLRTYSHLNVGNLMSRILNDVPEMAEVLGIAVAVIFFQIFTLILVSGVPIYFNWKLALVAFVMLPVYYISLRAFNGMIRETAREEREMYSQVTESLREKVEGIWAVKSLNRIEFFRKIFSSVFKSG